MVRSLILIIALCFSTGCSLLFSQTPTSTEWKNLEAGIYHPSMRCVPAGNLATLDALAAVGYTVNGVVAFTQIDNDLFSGFFATAAISSFVMAGVLAYSGYHGAQVNDECARFDAKLQAHFEQRGLNEPIPGPVTP